MPAYILYFLQVSIALAVVFLLYQFVFRRLTFYYCNRWYLLIASVLSFVVPLIDINPTLEAAGVKEMPLIEYMSPMLGNAGNFTKITAIENSGTFALGYWDVLMLVLSIVSTLLLLRFVFRLVSLFQLSKKAPVEHYNNIHIHHLEGDVQPFSFGKRIFLNSTMYDESETQRILLHEMAHVRGYHTIDIIWCELMCIINWFNPFAWMLRSAVKQNLEFIADNDVLRNGVDRKEYQYLLLKVGNNNCLPVTASFKYASVKSRIKMMNLGKHSRLHLLKFFTTIPLLLLLLLAFRQADKPGSAKGYTIVGIVYDLTTGECLGDAIIKDSVTGISATTDGRGFFRLNITTLPTEVKLWFYRDGYPDYPVARMNIGKEGINTFNISVTKDINGDVRYRGVSSYGAPNETNSKNKDYEYEFALKQLQDSKNAISVDPFKDDPRPVQMVNGLPRVFSNGGMAWFDPDEMQQMKEIRVWVDGKIMSMEEANRTVNRFQYNGVAAAPAKFVKERYGLDFGLFYLYKDSIPEFTRLGSEK